MAISFIKNSANTKINPATEPTLVAVKTQTNLLTFDAQGNLTINVVAGAVGWQNASNVTINPATEDTLLLVKGQTNKLTFDSISELQTTGAAPALAGSVAVKDTTSTSINPAQTESMILWRRMAKLLEAKASVNASLTKRVSLDSYSAGVPTGNGTMTGTEVQINVASDNSFTNPTTFTAPVTWGGWNNQMFADIAHNAYARGIRRRLAFS